MSEQLDKEIAQDRITHGKKPLKPAIKGEAKTKKMSMTAKLSLPFSQSQHRFTPTISSLTLVIKIPVLPNVYWTSISRLSFPTPDLVARRACYDRMISFMTSIITSTSVLKTKSYTTALPLEKATVSIRVENSCFGYKWIIKDRKHILWDYSYTHGSLLEWQCCSVRLDSLDRHNGHNLHHKQNYQALSSPLLPLDEYKGKQE